MTDHPLTETRAAELWNASLPATSWETAWILRPLGDRDRTHPLLAPLRTAYDAGREDALDRADPYHDPRPWQDCTREDIRKGDLVEARDCDRLHVGVAQYQDKHGDWWTKGNYQITWGDRWPLRRIPAPTPPAEEVELPDEPGEVLYDVTIMNPDGSVLRTAVAMLDEDGYWMGLWSGEGDSEFDGHRPRSFTSFTLPDGTRARRDGDREDWTPRFVKAQEEEK